ncbi:hypothetical protein J6590_047029 [Homalodisca vitripennis]|nr:hypothetical protein J6590_047029 [Homalodisca vitripennis]
MSTSPIADIAYIIATQQSRTNDKSELSSCLHKRRGEALQGAHYRREHFHTWHSPVIGPNCRNGRNKRTASRAAGVAGGAVWCDGTTPDLEIKSWPSSTSGVNKRGAGLGGPCSGTATRHRVPCTVYRVPPRSGRGKNSITATIAGKWRERALYRWSGEVSPAESSGNSRTLLVGQNINEILGAVSLPPQVQDIS